MSDGVDGAMQWLKTASAPKDGSRIIAAIRGGDEGNADIDVVRWTKPRNAADPCWTSTDSTHDCAIIYEEWEVTHWMPLPGSMPGVRTPNMAASLPAFPQAGEEIGGSGI